MSTATVMQNAQFRKELLDKLLCKKVTFQDVKIHGLSQQEMDYLHLNDILSRREYIRLVRKGGYSKQATYNKWRRVVKESIKEFDPKPYSNIIIALKRSSCIDAAKKLIKNKVEFTGELRESYEKLRVFLDILFEPTFDRKRHNPRNVALSPLLTESDMTMKCRFESTLIESGTMSVLKHQKRRSLNNGKRKNYFDRNQ